MSESSTLRFGPTVVSGTVLTVIFTTTAGLLAWLGMILDSSALDATDGFTLLLFMAVAIRLFSWSLAIVCLVLAAIVLHRTFRSSPTLVLTESGMAIHGAPAVPWSDVRTVDATRSSVLRITIGRAAEGDGLHVPPPAGTGRRKRKDRRLVTLSSFDLGADPAHVAREIEARRTGSGSNDVL